MILKNLCRVLHTDGGGSVFSELAGRFIMAAELVTVESIHR
jgi:hypothetical protein